MFFVRYTTKFLIDILKSLYMQLGKDNYLEVTYQPHKGLIFKWNFKDLFQHCTYFHHLFVVRQTDKNFLNQLLSNYYKKMKFGDLFAVIYYDQVKKSIKKSKWLEKTQLQAYDFSKLVQRMASKQLISQIKHALNMKAIQETSGDTQHFVVNYILQSDLEESTEQLQKMVQRCRKEGGLSYICTFFGYFKINNISFSNGINFLNVSQEQIHNIIPFYYIHLNQAAVKNAKITLQCTNGQLISHNSQIWCNIDFNKLEKLFYGPSVSYQFDKSIFTNRILQNITITLHITLFSYQQLNSSKKVKLMFRRQKICEKSLCLNKSEHFLNPQGLWMSSYPYSSFTIVRMIKQNIS